jgi:3-methyladenine DNA glycosylase AlkD
MESAAKIDPEKLARDIDRALRKGGTRARKEWTAGYYPSTAENLGVGAAHLRTVVRQTLNGLRGQKPRMALRVARAIVNQGTIEGRQAAYEILIGHPGAIDEVVLRDVEALGIGIDNWCSVDGFGCYVAGQAWRRGCITDRDVMRWATSEDRWWRRAAVVATVPLNARSRGGTGDTRRTLRLLEQVAADREPMVAKAVSWALRTLIAPDRAAVEEFLKDHDAELPALVKREVGNKLRTGKKNPGRRKEKVHGRVVRRAPRSAATPEA